MHFIPFPSPEGQGSYIQRPCKVSSFRDSPSCALYAFPGKQFFPKNFIKTGKKPINLSDRDCALFLGQHGLMDETTLEVLKTEAK
jgi:hypothetical protein